MSYIVASTDWSTVPVSCHCQDVLSAGRQMPPPDEGGVAVGGATVGVAVRGTAVAVGWAGVGVRGGGVERETAVGVAVPGVGVSPAQESCDERRPPVPVSRVE